MKKFVVTLLLASISIVSFGQADEQIKSYSPSNAIPEFLGIQVNGKRDAVIDAFKSKGFIVVGDINKGNVASMKGTVSGKQFELMIVSSPKSKIVWKFSVFLPEQSTWNSLKNNYFDYLKILSSKYGEPEKTYEFFSSPYKEGDGYEMTGVGVEKSHYSAFWSDEKGISISITKWKQVKISYENQNNSKIAEKETSEVDSTIF
jgi:hypothetical protein